MATHWDTNSEPIPGYRLLQRVGRGGYGEVWKAEAPGGLLKAVKFVYGDLGSDPDREAQRELRALTQVREIRHPFVLSIDRFDIVNNQLIIVTELADQDLSRRLFECRDQGLPGIPRAELIGYLREAAEALDAISSQYGMQHLDVKPQNLFLIGGHVKIADFGLIKVFEGRSAAFTGGITPIYACPESFDGWISRASDQYSLAIVFMEMLTGRLPFPGPSPRQFMLQHLTREANLDVLSEEDRVVVRRALSKHPESRFPSCTDFVNALSLTQSPVKVSSDTESSLAEMAITQVVRESARVTPDAVDEMEGMMFGVDAGLSDRSACRVALVIGVGETGLQCLRRIANCFPVRALESPDPASVHLIGIDTDGQSLEQTDSAANALKVDVVHCPLGKGNNYLRNWERHSHLKGWLNPNLLFNVSGTGSANGWRALGRLAFIDNRQRIAQEISEQLLRAKSAVRGRGIEVRVFVVASMAGGTGSGMFLDLCYLVRRILREQGVDADEVMGVLVSPSAVDSRPQAALNQWALAEEIDELSQPNSVFEVHTGADRKPETYACPPAHQLFVCTPTATEPSAAVSEAIEAISEFIVTSAVHRIHERDPELNGTRFSALGWLQVEYPEQRLLEATSRELGKVLHRLWCAPMASREAATLYEQAEQCLCQAGFEPESVMRKIQGLVDSRLDAPLHVELAQKLLELESDLRFDDLPGTASAFEKTLQEICESIGSDWDSELEPRQTPLRSVSQRAIDRAYHELADSLTQATIAALNSSGSRISRANLLVEGFGDFFLRTLDRCHQQVRVERQALSRQARAILDQAEMLRQSPHVPQRQVAVMHASLEHYGRAKIALRLREMAVQVYLRMRNKTAHLAEHLSQIRQRLDRWAESLQADEVQPESGSITQLLFPRKQLRFQDAKLEILKRLSAKSEIEELDKYVEAKTLVPIGGLWDLAFDESPQNAGMLPIEAAIQQWVTAHLPATDASHCIVELHGGDTTRIGQTLQTFFDWAAPGELLSDQSTSQHLLLVPPGRAGETIIKAAQPLLARKPHSIVRTGTRFVLCSTRTAASLTAILPRSLADFHDRYQQQCQSRTSPRVVPKPI